MKKENTDMQLDSRYTNRFVIRPEEWGIHTDGTHAEETTAGLNTAILSAKAQGYTEIVIPAGDYLIDGVSKTHREPQKEAGVQLPSDIRLIMDPNARLKVEANGFLGYSCLYLKSAQNVTIEGGQLIGERYEHDYDGDKRKDTHEYGFGIYSHGSHNIVIDNVRIKDFTGDGIFVASTGLLNTSDPYTPSSKVTIRNCTLDGNGRNNISITACDGALVENNLIINAGINGGYEPKYGLDIENYGEGGVDYEEALTVIVRNNVFRDNVQGAINNYNGYQVIIEGNHCDHTISTGYCANAVIANNVFYREDNEKVAIMGIGVSSGYMGNSVTITGNVIEGFRSGIQVQGKDMTVSANTVTNTTEAAIHALHSDNVLISGNSVQRCSGVPYRVTESSKVTLSGNKASESTGFGVELLNAPSRGEAESGQQRFNTTPCIISGNHLERCNGGVRLNESHAVIRDNVIDLRGNEAIAANYGISFGPKDHAVISGNHIIGSRNLAIYGQKGAGKKVAVLNNHIDDCTGLTAISLHQGVRPEIAGNHITFAEGKKGFYGIYVKGAEQALVAHNRVFNGSGEPVAHAIHTAESTASRVLGNAVGGQLNLNTNTDTVEGNVTV